MIDQKCYPHPSPATPTKAPKPQTPVVLWTGRSNARQQQSGTIERWLRLDDLAHLAKFPLDGLCDVILLNDGLPPPLQGF